MIKKLILTAATLFAFQQNAVADEYWISQYRAAQGKFPELLDVVKATDWKALGFDKPIMMRHSQGNHWDLMLLGAGSTSCETDACSKAHDAYETVINTLVDSEVSFTAKSDVSWTELQKLNETSGLYHIEMFMAGAGKHEALLKERQMENDYLVRIGIKPNVIFETIYGSDVDNFTVGFYRDLVQYAKRPDMTPAEMEAAAKASGFKNRADISFLLRELIVGHHDTLAVKVQ
ncbi:hypothetical protein [Kordiimonas sp. SCSIO 12610]|uniref:hypothetical protein n=1 Tax=Kordiimonas sp. SCSIO 12610 TaxID=2829597 RepID=UPI002108BB22|nr:hypothetical protein [Kordiimonas sp. SCSIO 12610]UTW56425.1 hypothetical protein KFF44_05845 [Kordiimonas sp. SCSIO 12610]